jgi:hypothetical protein
MIYSGATEKLQVALFLGDGLRLAQSPQQRTFALSLVPPTGAIHLQRVTADHHPILCWVGRLAP